MTLKEHIGLLSDVKKIENQRLASYAKKLTRESTVELIQRINKHSDRMALDIFLETRKLFRLKGQPSLLLPEFLSKLRERLAQSDEYGKGNVMLSDCTYDLTLARYSNLPDTANHKTKPDEYFLKATNVDCRNYYRHFLRVMERLKDQGKIRSQAEQEAYAGKIFQRMVYKNFLRSKMECKRNNPFSVRYIWLVNKHRFYLWYPSYINVKRFKDWLKKNVQDVNPERIDEQRRIQTIIDENFGRGYHIYLDDKKAYRTSDMLIMDKPSPVKLMEGHLFVDGLATAVAQKKVEEIHELRPSISKLGEKTLERMILQIFSDLSYDDYKAVRIANLYGISKSTLSRFAGFQWVKQIGENKRIEIPVLWQNTAMILAEIPDFMEAVLASGVAGKLEDVMDIIKRNKGEVNE